MVKVGIIGAGAAGLCAIKSCLDEGLEPFCFEQHDNIGGVWYYSDKRRKYQGACVSKNVITNVSKYNMSFHQYMMGKEYPCYMPHEKYFAYLLDYASHFNLLKYVQFCTIILDIKKDRLSQKWIFQLEDSNENIHELTFDCVMICSGYSKEKFVPDIIGINVFQGSMYHSIDYRQPNIFSDKTVLVIGNQNTAADIATDASLFAKSVYLSAGEGMSLISRSYLSKPSDLKLTRFIWSLCSDWFLRKVFIKVQSAAFPHEKYGLGKVRFPFADGAAAITEDLQFRIVSGKVEVIPRVIEFEKNSFITIDGIHRHVDIVVFCTGYRPKFEFLSLPDIEGKNSASFDVYKTVFPLSEQSRTLAFINAVAPIMGAHPTLIELSCRWATRVFAKKVKLPSENQMLGEVEKRSRYMQQHCRNRFKVIWLTLADEIADEIGCYPSFSHLFLLSPKMAFKVLFGPALSVHYRLMGPGYDTSAWKITNDIYDLYGPSISITILKLLLATILLYFLIKSVFSVF